MSNRIERRGCSLWRFQSFWIVALTGILLVLSGCSGKAGDATAAPGGGKGGGRGGRGGGDVPVTVAVASVKDVPVEVHVIGHVEAYATISVKAQTTGELLKATFHEGDYIKKGDLLFSIDSRPSQAALNQASANVARDQASLGQAQANLARDMAQANFAQSQADRYAKLFQEKVVSRDQAEQFRTNAAAAGQAVEADKAAVESAKAAIGASKAAVENARVTLGYTEIRSPIDGRLGNFAVKPGNIVTANNLELVTINQIEPIYVTFGVPESQLPAIKEYMAQGPLRVAAQPQDDNNAPTENGTLTFVDNAVDATTGTITLKGTFVNTDHKLWPGQYVRVTLRLTTQKNAVTVPNEAVMTGQNGSYVYVVKADKTVETRNVTSGARVGQDMVIDTGLLAGETVVTEGQLRLAPGSKVVVRDGRGRGAAGQGVGATPQGQQGAPAGENPAAGDTNGGGKRGGRGGRKGPTQQ